jgi:hypothetical protein
VLASHTAVFNDDAAPDDCFGAQPGDLFAGAQCPLWVDCGPSCIVRRSAAVGGEPTFAEAMVNGEVALYAVLDVP